MRRVALYLLLLISILWFLQGWLLPFYLENHLLPQLAGRAGFSRISCQVRHVGFSGLELGPVELEKENELALSVAAVFVSYSPLGLAKKHLGKIHISGLSIPLKRKGEMVTFGAVPLISEKDGAGQNEKEPQSGAFQLPATFSAVTIDSSEIIYQESDLTVLVPFQLEMTSSGKNGALNIGAEFRLGEGILDLDGKVDLLQRNIHGGVVVKGFPLLQGAKWGGIPTMGVSDGSLDAQADFEVNFTPFNLINASGELSFRNLKWQNEGFALSQREPVTVYGEWQSERKIAIRMSPLLFDGSATGALSMNSLTVDLVPSASLFEGNWSLGLTQLSLTGNPLRLEKELNFEGRLSGAGRPERGWGVEIKGQKMSAGGDVKTADVAVAKEQALIWLGNDRFTCSGKGGKIQTHFDCDLRLEKLQATFLQGQMQIDDFLARASVNLTKEESPGKLQSRVELRAKGIKVTGDNYQALVPGLEATGEYADSVNPAGSWKGDIRTEGARLVNSDQGFRAEKISFLLPWRFPASGQEKSGQLRVGRILHKGRKLGSVQAELSLQKSGWVWNGRWRDILQPATVLHFSGQADKDFSQTSLKYSLDRSSFDLGRTLGGYVSQLAGLEAKGDLHLAGEISWANQRLSSPTRFSLQNLDCLDQERQLRCQGLALNLEFIDLFTLYPAGRPYLTFEKLSLADVILENGRVNFLVGRDLELLVEKLAFNWCGGRVFSESFRVRPGVESLDIALYCDRVNLVQVMEQLGAARAEGTGSLNGRIPIHYENGQFSVMDGFLFSTPGEGGTLHVSGMENLTAGLPGDDRTFGQLKLAEEALKDYEYKWARLAVNSEDDDLLVKVQMDGHPSNPLPFVYRKEFGGFVRAEADFPGTKFEGIRLDLNFRIPLNKLLEYKNLFKLMN